MAKSKKKTAKKKSNIAAVLTETSEIAAGMQEDNLALKDKPKATKCIYCDADPITTEPGEWMFDCNCSAIKQHPVELVKRARKIGLTTEQIETYTDSASLKMACDNIKPEVTPQPKTKRPLFRRRGGPNMRDKGTPAVTSFTTEISELRVRHVNRVDYDDRLMHDHLRRNKIDTRSIQKVTIERNYVGDDIGVLKTEMVIDYLKKG